MLENEFLFSFNSGFEVLGPRSLDPRWNCLDLIGFDLSQGPRNSGTPVRSFWSQILIPIQAFPFVGWPVMPFRRQLGGRGSVRRWLEAVGVPSGSHSLLFQSFEEH